MCVSVRAQTFLGLVAVCVAIILFELLVGCVKMKGGLMDGPGDGKLFVDS